MRVFSGLNIGGVPTLREILTYNKFSYNSFYLEELVQ